jgi:hypothetical protein
MLHLLTPTGGRPECLALLTRWINDQTYGGQAVWVIVDDVNPRTPIPDVRDGIQIRYIRPSWRWEEGMNTQAATMAAGLARVPDDATLLILEDDDVYLPCHIMDVLEGLIGSEMVGERVARYYNVSTRRFRLMGSLNHAALASVGLRGKALSHLRELCNAGSKTIDLDLWRHAPLSKSLRETENVIGIKGMPGRGGIGVGHRPTFGEQDDGTVLTNWLGTRAQAYLPFHQ